MTKVRTEENYRNRNAMEERNESSVFSRLDFSSRAEDRLERRELEDRRGGRREKRVDRGDRREGRGVESPRKKDRRSDTDLRKKVRRSIKENSDQVQFSLPPAKEKESDPEVLARREKQISYGKNTVDYDAYIKMVAKTSRGRGMPRTPDKSKKYSRRQWDGMVKSWKQQIHGVASGGGGFETETDSETGRRSSASSIGSWSDDVEQEEVFRRKRLESGGESTDQGLFSGEEGSGTPSNMEEGEELLEFTREEEVHLGNSKVELGDSEEDFIDA